MLNLRVGTRVLFDDDATKPGNRGVIVAIIPLTIAGESYPLYKVRFDDGTDAFLGNWAPGQLGPYEITEVKE